MPTLDSVHSFTGSRAVYNGTVLTPGEYALVFNDNYGFVIESPEGCHRRNDHRHKISYLILKCRGRIIHRGWNLV